MVSQFTSKTRVFLQIFLLFLGVSSAVHVFAKGEEADRTGDNAIYTLGPNDEMEITVFAEPDLTVKRTVSTEGDISYPLLGQIHVQGLTINELEQKLTDQLKGNYLIDPKVNVSILTYRDFFVRGEVKKPGSFPYRAGVTVDTSIAIAGGFTERANQKVFTLSRENREGKREELEVKLKDKLLPGDILIVNESFF